MKTIKKENIIFILYNGIGRPHQIFTDNLDGFDCYFKYKELQCDWCSGNIRPFLSELSPKWKAKKKLKVWFKEDFRPLTNSASHKHILTDEEIEEMGYIRILEPTYLNEIIDVFDYY